MNDVTAQLERMAERGSPRGAAALVADIRRNPSGEVTVVQPPSSGRPRRPTGPLLAAAVAAVVIAVGAGLGWFVSPATPVSPTGITWQQLTIGTGVDGPVSGPGGFITWGLSPDDEASGYGLWLSADGLEWTPTGRSDGMGDHFFVPVVATDDRWMIAAESDDGAMEAWWSEDGVSWVPVAWPVPITDTVTSVVATSDWFFAVSTDVFGDGTTMWRSADGESWTNIETGSVDPSGVRATAGGLVAFDGDRILVSSDATSWVGADIDPPADMNAKRVTVEAVDWTGDRWIAVASIERVGQPPLLATFTSDTGDAWSFEAVPSFGEVEGSAVTVFGATVIGDRLVVAPATIPTSTRADGVIAGSGTVTSTREIWSTTDGIDWVKELDTDREVLAVGGGDTPSGPVGLWYGIEDTSDPDGSSDEPESVVTTMVLPPAGDLDQDGLDYQSAAAEDGELTREEFEGALEGWKRCMEERGVTEVEYQLDPSGGWSSGYSSPSPNGDQENAIDNLCRVSWVEQLSAMMYDG